MPKQPGICGLSNTSRLDQRCLCRDPFLCASRPWLAVFTRGPTWVEQNHVVICVVQVSCPIRINFESGACQACQWMSQDVIGFFFIRRLRRVRASLSAAQVVQKPCLGWRMSRLRDSIHMAMDQAGQAIKDRDQIFAYFEYWPSNDPNPYGFVWK